MDCVQKAQDYVKEQGLKISPRRIAEIGEMLRVAGGDALSPAEFNSKLQKVLDEDVVQYNARQQAERLQVLAKQAQGIQFLKANKEAMPKIGAVQHLINLLDGSAVTKGDGVSLDPKRMTDAWRDMLSSVWQRGIEGVEKEANLQGPMFRDSLIELNALQKGLAVGETKNVAAQKIAKAAYATQGMYVKEAAAANPWFESIENYLIRNIHMREKVGAVERNQWVGDAMKAFGVESFPELSPPAKLQVMGELYDRIKAGTFGSLADATDTTLFQRIPGDQGNIMRRMSRERQLIPSSPEALYEYASKYGYDTMADAMEAAARRQGRDLALLSKYGPVPKDTVEGWIRGAIKAFPEEADSIKRAIPGLQRRFGSVMGVGDAPAQGQVGRWLQAAMAAEYMAKTSGILRAFPDIALTVSRMRDMTGKNTAALALDLTYGTFKHLLSDPVTSAGAKEALNDMAMALKFTGADAQANLGGGGDLSGKFQGGIMKAANAWGALTMHKQWINSHRAAAAFLLNRIMGTVVDNGAGWAEIGQGWQDGFKRYGFTEHGYSALLEAPLDTVSGRKVLTTESIRQIPDEAITQMMHDEGRLGDKAPSSKTLDYERAQLALKYGTMVNDHVDFGTINPNSRQKFFITQGLPMDSGAKLSDVNALATGMRLMMHLKTAAVVTMDQYRRTWNSGEALSGKLSNVGRLAAMTGFYWAMGEYASQLATGKTPQDPTSPEMLAKLVVGTGAGGMAADMVEQSLHERGMGGKAGAMAEYLAGPVAETGFNAIGLGVEAAQALGEDKDLPGGDIGRFVVDQTPFHNLFWTKAVFNFYLANGFREMLHEGYLNNLENSVNSKAGMLEPQQRYYMLKPTDSPRWR